ncbi:hypothetical protein BpHYR1_047730 [Brachionus plicatilis]|uniref:Uncharacterized protein n=1 Tax=Brachionus plicatilis TaxID=10195 RepID=A0A3M7P275_BRAPC|nr:hypothetical protein BpHYR1_047730 [Brachionus plicatilis]
MIERGTLYLKGKTGKFGNVPKHKQLEICSLNQDTITSGHLRFEKTFRSFEASGVAIVNEQVRNEQEQENEDQDEEDQEDRMVESEVENQKLTEDDSNDFQDTNTTILDKNKDNLNLNKIKKVKFVKVRVG